jgi:hypothetical protein
MALDGKNPIFIITSSVEFSVDDRRVLKLRPLIISQCSSRHAVQDAVGLFAALCSRMDSFTTQFGLSQVFRLRLPVMLDTPDSIERRIGSPDIGDALSSGLETIQFAAIDGPIAPPIDLLEFMRGAGSAIPPGRGGRANMSLAPSSSAKEHLIEMEHATCS